MSPKADRHIHGKHYVHLAVMTGFMFAIMYALMYAMVDRFANVYANLNQIYMAGLMTAPMVLIELVVMRAMYANRRLNTIAVAASAILGVVCWFGIREQAGIGNEQFLRSMIPHHAGAILMCEESSARSAEIQRLCANIVASQQREIAEMKSMLLDEQRKR